MRLFLSAITLSSIMCACNGEKSGPGNLTESSHKTSATVIPDNNDCVDRQMTLWFDLFDKYQQEGLDMFEAHEKAMSAANAALVDCESQVARTLTAKASVPKKVKY
jgi:hypothetical protein